jgi:hypothetical protein
MAYDCRSAAQESSMGDKGIAIKQTHKFEGDPDQDMKFEGKSPSKTADASEAEYTGRQ